MFLFKLNHPQKVAFIKLANRIATMDDGIADEAESEMLNMMCKEMELCYDPDSEDIEMEELTQVFDSKEARNICLLEAVGIALTNGNYHNEQRELIFTLNEAFGYDEEHLKEMEAWVEKMAVITREGTELLLS